jgi:hypothetical protein
MVCRFIYLACMRPSGHHSYLSRSRLLQSPHRVSCFSISHICRFLSVFYSPFCSLVTLYYTMLHTRPLGLKVSRSKIFAQANCLKSIEAIIQSAHVLDEHASKWVDHANKWVDHANKWVDLILPLKRLSIKMQCMMHTLLRVSAEILSNNVQSSKNIVNTAAKPRRLLRTSSNVAP